MLFARYRARRPCFKVSAAWLRWIFKRGGGIVPSIPFRAAWSIDPLTIEEASRVPQHEKHRRAIGPIPQTPRSCRSLDHGHLMVKRVRRSCTRGLQTLGPSGRSRKLSLLRTSFMHLPESDRCASRHHTALTSSLSTRPEVECRMPPYATMTTKSAFAQQLTSLAVAKSPTLCSAGNLEGRF